jgi:hypothetical protein
VEIQYAYGSGTGERAVLVLGVSDLDVADRLLGNGAGKGGGR